MVAKESKMFICFFCDERFSDKQRLTRHQDACNLRAFGLETLFKFKRLKLPQNLEHQESERNQRSFLECFDIVSVGRAAMLGKRDRKEQIVCDVIVIDDSDEDDVEADLPTPPTSPQRLIPSDSKNFRRTSSFCPRSDEKNAVVIKRDNDVIATSRNVEKLLRIDVSSPLGQRLREHMDMLNASKSETREDERLRSPGGNVGVPSNENLDSETTSDRLRRCCGDWPVTFRSSRQQWRSHSHVYRFSSRQRIEFCCAFDCGLSIRARRLLGKMKPCRVDIPRLTPKDIETYRSNMRGSEPTSYRNRLVLRIPKSALFLTKCQVTQVTEATGCDPNRSEGGDRQVIPDRQSNVSNTQTPPTIPLPPPDNSRPYFHGEPFVNKQSDLVAENGKEASSQSLRECPSSNAAVTAMSDLLPVNISNDTTDAVSNHSVCVAADKENRPRMNCPHLVNTAGACSNVARKSPVSARTAKTAEKDSVMEDPDPDSMDEAPTTTDRVETSEWSMSADLPALSFLCNICGDLVDCERDARSLIYDHYAAHGITNIELIDERTPTGDTVIKLVELPASKTANSSRTARVPVPPTDVTQKRPAKSILVRDRTSAPLERVELDADSSSGANTQRKRRRVTWADEVLSSSASSPLRYDATSGSPSARLASAGSQALTSNYDSVASTVHDTTFPTVLPETVALPTTPTVMIGDNLSFTAVLPARGESSAESVSLSRMSDTASTNSRRPRIATAASRRRARMFWSNSSLRRGTSTIGDHSTTDEHPVTPVRSCSTALPYRAANVALPSISDATRELRSADGVGSSRRSPQSLSNVRYTQEPPPADTIMPTSNISLVSNSRKRSPTHDMRLNSCHQLERNVIYID